MRHHSVHHLMHFGSPHLVHLLAKSAIVALLWTTPGAINGVPVPATQVAYGRTPDGACVVGGAAEMVGVKPDESCRPVQQPDGGWRAP